MKIKEFVEAYKAKRFMITKNGVDERCEYIKNALAVKDYIPFEEKKAIVQTVLTNCSSIKDGTVVIDSIQKYILFTMSMLVAYTNLEPDDGVGIFETYDALCTPKVDDDTLLDAIIKTFELEYVRCNDILNMMTADLLAENNIERQVGRFLTTLSDNVNKIGDRLIDKLGDFNMDLSQLDIDKLTNMIGKIK